MGKLLPAAFEVLPWAKPMVTQSEAQVSATPVYGTQPARQITWTVHEGESKSDARAVRAEREQEVIRPRWSFCER